MNKVYEIINAVLTHKIIGSFYKVYNTLGYGFLEKVYVNALIIEMTKTGLKVESQKQIKVYYEEEIVGEYYADIIVNDLVIVETKAKECLLEEHKYQLINYLKASDKQVGILLNFGKKSEFRRVVFSNYNKSYKYNKNTSA